MSLEGGGGCRNECRSKPNPTIAKIKEKTTLSNPIQCSPYDEKPYQNITNYTDINKEEIKKSGT
jgi:hypothetical protein